MNCRNRIELLFAYGFNPCFLAGKTFHFLVAFLLEGLISFRLLLVPR